MPEYVVMDAGHQTGRRLRDYAQFDDPAFDGLRGELDRVATVAWDGYKNGRKAPRTRKAGPDFANPDYELSVDWVAAREAISQASLCANPPSRAARPRG